MIFHLFIIIIFQKYIKTIFKKFNYHELFRSFFCFIISTLSLITCFLYWNELIINPLGSRWISSNINKFMLSYIGYDTLYYLNSNNYRIDLLIHHVICGIIFAFYYDKLLLTFCSINEIISAFNWVGILFPHLLITSKIIKLCLIVFVRFVVWAFVLFLLNSSISMNLGLGLTLMGINIGVYTIIPIVLFFIGLDFYWIYIIVKNFLLDKHKIK